MSAMASFMWVTSPVRNYDRGLIKEMPPRLECMREHGVGVGRWEYLCGELGYATGMLGSTARLIRSWLLARNA